MKAILYIAAIILSVLLLSCTEQPTRDNPYDPGFDLPEPEISGLDDISLTSKLLSWDYELDNIEGFLINRRDDTVWQEGILVTPDERTFLDTAAAVNKHIQYKIKAVAGENESDYVNSVILDNIIPAPTNFNVVQVNVHCYDLSWEQDHIIGEDGFILERKIEDGEFEDIAVLNENVENYQDEWDYSRDKNTVYYRIKTYVGDVYSSEVYANDQILQAPSNLNYIILAINRIALDWVDNNEGEQGFKIDKKIGENDWIEKYASVDTDTISWFDENAEINENLSYRVFAYFGDIVSDFVDTGMIDNTFPAPSNLNYNKIAINQIELSWQDNSEGEEGFRIEKKVGENDWIEVYATVDSNVISWIDDNAEINVNLSYKVFAYLGEAVSDFIDTVMIDNDIPVPANLELSVVENIVELTWEYDLGGIEGFRIEKKSIDGDWPLYADDINPDLREWSDPEIEDLNSYRIMAFYQEYESDVSNKVIYIPNWVNVSAGDFTWGQNDEIQTIDHDYWIMKYEVTNQEYVWYLDAALTDGVISVTSSSVTGYYSGDENYGAGDYEYYDLDGYGRISWDGNNFIIEDGFDEHPVIEISWFGANAYAEYYGLRLPTEQEWEKAARGMTGYEYPWGDELSGDRANYYDSGDPWDNRTTPVGYYNGENGTTDSPSAYGCYDMCGNVCDWTDSWISSTRVMRGGAWSLTYTYVHLRSWYRYNIYPAFTDNAVGFRCARDIEVRK